MNHKVLILVILILFLFGNLIFASPKVQMRKFDLALVKSLGEGVLNYPGLPVMGYNITAIDDSYFFVYDSKGKHPFYALDKKTLQLKGFGSWGQGPGEVLMNSPAVISRTGTKFFVYLPMQRKLMIFSKKDLKFLKEIKISLEMGALYMVSDNEGIFINPFSKEAQRLAERCSIDESGKVSSAFKYAEYKRISAPEIGLDKLKKNPFLKQGPIHVDKEGNFYFAHYYSSLIIFFSKRGDKIIFQSSPREIEIPEAEVKERGGIISGDPERSIQSYLSLTSDERYLYVLFSGEEITMEKVIAFRTGKSKELNLGEGKIVDVFKKEDLSYVLSFELPVLATSIAVDNENLYATTVENEPCILIFKKPKF